MRPGVPVHFLRPLFFSLLAGTFLVAMHGEPLGHSVEGIILDPSRTPIANAIITATPENGVAAVSTYSGRAGEFAFDMKPGNYTVLVSAEGFQQISRTIAVNANAAARLEIVMALAHNQQMVTVTETANYQVAVSQSTKAPTPLLDVPQSISVVTQELIRDQAMQNMADVVRYVPGITMAQGEGHRDAPVIRGNATTADFYVNGVRDDVQYYRDLYNVESVEAVKGANALSFGRGGGGGVINRVTKQAQFFPIREVALQGGSFRNRRVAGDFSQGLNDKLAFRMNGVYENSDSFREFVELERYGLAPTLTFKPGDHTALRVGYEYFNDGRTVDRGIPSYQGRPSDAPRYRFFGNPDDSRSSAGVNLGTVSLEHQLGRMNLRNNTLVGDYDKFYQNVFPGAVNADQTLVSISGYNNSTLRRNLFNQTDVSGFVNTGSIRHTVLMGTEVGRQRSDNFRQTAYFNSTATSTSVPFADPLLRTPANFRQSATDADNYAINKIAAIYMQDQIELSRYFQVVAGVRYDYFDIDFHDNRSRQNLGRQDHMVSPRAGVVIKPIAPLSIYSSYSISYLPSAGDQFSSLNATTQTLKPEKFTNYEVGTKWNINRSFSFTTALYRLDRVNTTARDPNDPARIVQTGSQRTNGFELGVNGNLTSRWSMVGGYAHQDALVSNPTTAAVLGAKVALVPNNTLSLWNNYRLMRRWGMGLGLIHQADMYAGIDNTVKLPSFTRADLATHYSLSEMVRLQLNVENLFDNTYYGTAHSNNNIMPGFSRAVRIGLIARF